MSEPRSPRYGTPNFPYIQRMLSMPPDEDGPVYMVNLMKYHEVAQYEGEGEAARSGREADDEYAPTEILRDIGARIVFVADVIGQPLGEPKWDRIGIVRYPTRRAFMEMQRRGDFKQKHVHKEAGMQQTIVMSCLPEPIRELPEPPPEPLAEGDAPFVMLHVMKYTEGGRQAMERYEATAGATGLNEGARPRARLRVEGTVLGDGREWDEVRFNRFPSMAAFQRLIANEDHSSRQQLRASALSDTYAIMVRPTRDQIFEATQSDLAGGS